MNLFYLDVDADIKNLLLSQDQSFFIWLLATNANLFQKLLKVSKMFEIEFYRIEFYQIDFNYIKLTFIRLNLII